MFEGLALHTSAATDATRRQVQSAGFTAPSVSEGARLEWEDEVTLEDLPEILDTERFYLERIVASLSRKPTDLKLDVCWFSVKWRAGVPR
jgi:hypothetical protein